MVEGWKERRWVYRWGVVSEVEGKLRFRGTVVRKEDGTFATGQTSPVWSLHTPHNNLRSLFATLEDSACCRWRCGRMGYVETTKASPTETQALTTPATGRNWKWWGDWRGNREYGVTRSSRKLTKFGGFHHYQRHDQSCSSEPAPEASARATPHSTSLLDLLHPEMPNERDRDDGIFGDRSCRSHCTIPNLPQQAPSVRRRPETLLSLDEWRSMLSCQTCQPKTQMAPILGSSWWTGESKEQHHR